MKKVLIVLNYNDYETTEVFINSIKNYSSIDKIIIVDNNSTDDSYMKLLKLKSTNIDIIKTEKNDGYASGNNFGMKYAKKMYNPQYFIISNPDIYFKEDVIDKLLVNFTDNKIALVSGQVIENGQKAISAWKLSSYYEELASNFIIFDKLIFKKRILYKSNDIKNGINNVEVLPGCFFIASAESMEKVGYFNSDTFLYYEEAILSYKLKKQGYEIILDNEVVYNHQHGHSINKSIGSKLKKYEILQYSKQVYLEQCLRVSKAKVVIFRVFSKIGYIERVLAYNIFKE